MGRESLEKEKEDKEPIVDIELNEAALEYWEKKGLKNEINDLVFGFEDLVEPNDRFVLHVYNFNCTEHFVKAAERSFSRFKAKNTEEKIKEVENETRKAILDFAFRELEIDPKNPTLLREEEREGNGEKLKVKCFATAYPNLVLATDSIDWWLERK